MAVTDEMKVKAVAPWFGSNRMLAMHVGEELQGCRWVGVPFAGGMCELAHIHAPSIAVNDKHRHVMNLASVIAASGPDLARQLARMPFHPDVLKFAQEHCREMERGGFEFTSKDVQPDERWALNYFICCWMGRSHKSGIDDEFNGGLSVRWNGNGGDSNKRYRSALRGLAEWQRIMKRCNFTTVEALDFLARCEDADRHGIYCDPPFPGPGDRYKFQFPEADHRRMAVVLAAFQKTRVVCRFYDHSLIREIYPESRWTWRRLKGRTQANNEAPEVLIINGPSRAKGGDLFA